MTYRVTRSAHIEAVIASLPRSAMVPFAEASEVLAMVPWNGMPFVGANPDGSLRKLVFGDGQGLVTYLVVEHRRQVDIVSITWLGD